MGATPKNPPMNGPNTAPAATRPRIDLVDALRGSALAGLFLLHCVEHFEMGGGPTQAPAWIQALDSWVHPGAFFLFSGKAYAIFACMFGLSFFLQLDGAARRGEDYRWRFLWRLGVLAGIGYLNGILFCGDILMIIAVLGLPLVLFQKASNRLVAACAAFLLLQVPAMWTIGRIYFAGYVPPSPLHWSLYGKLCALFANGPFTDVVSANLGQGQTVRFWYTFETGRYLQMTGLFLVGLLLGRSRIFEDAGRALRFGKYALIGGVIGFAVLHPLARWTESLFPEGMARYPVTNLVNSYVSLAQMAFWIGAFILLYHGTRAERALRWLAPYGRTSLTCYVTQALFWVPFYYGFGLAMYRHIGATLSILAGIPFLILQCFAAHVWLRHFRYGPLEWFWRACTRLDFSTPLRRRAAPVASPALVPTEASVSE